MQDLVEDTVAVDARAKKLLNFVEALSFVILAAASISLLYKVWFGSASPATLVATEQSKGIPKASDELQNIEDQFLALAPHGAADQQNPDAKVVIVEVSDFECPYCGQFVRETLPQINQQLIAPHKAGLLFVHLPLEDIHSHAFEAAQAAECAGRQANFWDMHDRLFHNQQQLTATDLLGHAKAAGLDTAVFQTCLTYESAVTIRANAAEALRLGVRATPTFFVGTREHNGSISLKRRISGVAPYQVFADAVTELNHTRQ